MKRIIPIALVSLLVAACAAPCPAPVTERIPRAAAVDPQNPNVTVVDGKSIVVDQEPLVFNKSMTNVVITWRLPRDGAYTFPKDGIAIQNAGDEFANCHPQANGYAFSCVNVHAKAGTYKYAIKVTGTPAVPPLDPTIVNY